MAQGESERSTTCGCGEETLPMASICALPPLTVRTWVKPARRLQGHGSSLLQLHNGLPAQDSV
jgi:hypothetical protein